MPQPGDAAQPLEADFAQHAVSPRQHHAALFLDRDGVINEDSGYTHRIEDFVFVDGIFELARAAAARGMPIVVVTNQAGIGRGLYSEQQFQRLTAWMCERFAEAGAPLAGVLHCPYHPTEAVGEYRRESEFRKPGPGMLLQARDELGLDLARSVLVGDKPSDIEAGRRAGVGTTLWLVREGAAPDAGSTGATAVITQLHEALPWLARPPVAGAR